MEAMGRIQSTWGSVGNWLVAVLPNILGTGSWWDAQCSHTGILGAEREMRSRCDEEGTVGSTWTISIPPSKAGREERAGKDGGGQRSPGEQVSHSFLFNFLCPLSQKPQEQMGARCGGPSHLGLCISKQSLVKELLLESYADPTPAGM